MQIEVATTPTEELWDALQRLIPQLTANHPPPSRDALAALLGSQASRLLIARLPDAQGPVLGAATLTIYRVPTGIRAMIEDVIVDESARGQGIGEALVRRALALAREAGAGGVSLTSNPMRLTANKLYQKIGFVRRQTNAYQYFFDRA
jgi:ribosomal protein S18 acetylase RimI-like enzyme